MVPEQAWKRYNDRERSKKTRELGYHVFIDFKTVFGMVRHDILWLPTVKYITNSNIIWGTEELYAYLLNGSTCDRFKTTVAVLQAFQLSPVLFNIILGRIACEALDDQEGSASLFPTSALSCWDKHYDHIEVGPTCRKERRSWRPGRPPWCNNHKVQRMRRLICTCVVRIWNKHIFSWRGSFIILYFLGREQF